MAIYSRVIRCIEFLLCFGIVAALLIAAFPPGWLSLEVEDLQVSVDGVDLRYSASIDVDSKMYCGIGDLDIRISMVDDERGSRIIILDQKDLAIQPRDHSLLVLEQKFFLPTALLMLRDFSGDPDSPVSLRADVSFSYMFGLLRFDTVSDVIFRLSEDGKSIAVEELANEEHLYSVGVTELRKDLVPDDMEIVLSHGTCSMILTVDNTGGRLELSAYSDGGLDDAITYLDEQEEIDIDCHGITDIGQERAHSLLGMLRYARGI